MFFISNNLIFILLLELLILYYVSHKSLQSLYYVLKKLFRFDTFVFGIISLLFLPGTLLHELSHYLTAKLLLLKVVKFSIIPEFQGREIKLGKVVYEQRDILRGTLVGISPLVGGLFFFWLLTMNHITISPSFWINAIYFYLIFVVSSNMFSSKQDMVDFFHIVPFLILIVVVYLFLPVHVHIEWTRSLYAQDLSEVLTKINVYVFISILLHLFTIAIVFLMRYIRLI